MRARLRSAVRALYRATLPPRTRSALGAWIALDEVHKAPTPITDWSPSPVLVLAPHMDDEAIGAGGAIALHARAGAAVDIIVATDGSWGLPALRNHDPALDDARRALTQRRKDESRRCADILGARGVHFLDAPDGAMTPTDALRDALIGRFNATPPAVVYVPSVFDSHPDHWATCLLLARACHALPRRAVIREYEVWTPMPVTRIADITPVIEIKRRAVGVFESQLDEVDFVATSTGLAQYRAVHFGGGGGGRGYAEGFRDNTPAGYAELVSRLHSRKSL